MVSKQAQERLREYENVVEALDQMIVVINREYRYVLANQSFLDYRGMTREQVVGHHISDVWGVDIFQSFKGKLDEVLRGSTIRDELKYRLPGNGERDLLVDYFPIEGPAGIDRIGCIIQDVTKLRQAERDREKLFEELQASNEQLQVLSNRLVEVQEEQRKRLAREIHDQINQMLTALMTQSGVEKSLVVKPTSSALSGYQELSFREREILRLIAKGYTNKEIAEELALSVRTVERHRSSIMNKAGLHNRAQLIAFAVHHDIFGSGED